MIAESVSTPAGVAPPGYPEKKAVLLADMRRAGPVGRGVRADLHRLAALADAELRRLWHAAGLDPGTALLAVGGYGRRELFPHSDVDLLVLIPAGSDGRLHERTGAFIASCWDAGLEISSSVRTVEESLTLARRDVTVCTTLLDARRIAGSRVLAEALRARFREQLDPLAFLAAKRIEQRQRHLKYHETPYALEPNCKESPGGLRDLQLLLWIANAAGIGSRWDDLRAAGLTTAHETRQLRQNEALLSRLRSRLHVVAGRREDRLVFDLQIALAESFGFHPRDLYEGHVRLRASEILMRRYYWAAKAVVQLSQILLQVLEQDLRHRRGEREPRASPINARFRDREGLLELADDALYQRDPAAIMETFVVHAAAPGIRGLSVQVLRALYNARSLMGPAFRRDAGNRENFLTLLRQTGEVSRTLRLMNETSVLGRYSWAFRRIVGQMQHDLYHVYTVDQHILTVVRNVERFFLPQHAHEFPFCSRLAAGWDKPWLLLLAALFHDIAKGRGGHHSELGARVADRFCRDHGLPREDRELVVFLVREHLSMSRVAQQQDLGDPAVIAAFAAQVASERNLTGLYLLTVADIRGTSPTVWTAWKAKLLQDLYHAAARVLGGWTPNALALVETRKRDARARLLQAGHGQSADPALWQALDVEYFMHHEADDIAWHTDTLSQLLAAGKIAPDTTGPTIVRARRPASGGGLQVLIYTRDRRDLFARICGYFERAALSIVDARIHTTRSGWALDTFQITSAADPEYAPGLPERLELALQLAVDSSEELTVPRLGRGSARARSFPVVPRVELKPDEKAEHWLLTLQASDRAGVLYAIAWVLAQHRVSVELAKITTLGERIEDMFLVRGERLGESSERTLLEQELVSVLTLAQ